MTWRSCRAASGRVWSATRKSGPRTFRATFSALAMVGSGEAAGETPRAVGVEAGRLELTDGGVEALRPPVALVAIDAGAEHLVDVVDAIGAELDGEGPEDGGVGGRGGVLEERVERFGGPLLRLRVGVGVGAAPDAVQEERPVEDFAAEKGSEAIEVRVPRGQELGGAEEVARLGLDHGESRS